MRADTTRLSKTVTVKQYKELELKADRQALGEFVCERFNERYFEPIRSSSKRHGFTIMAICCLVIETLECFYQGKAETSGKKAGEKAFGTFFARITDLNVFGTDFGEGDNWFYKNIRCGILHQSETKGGWHIRQKGLLLDQTAKCINADKFLDAVCNAVDGYADQLRDDDALWECFKKKMRAICDNCV